ncbi:MAG TPA: nuclear transport factor 2 family protein [Chryseolinea sp.]|nr:nuclear transport factor 2 family protein [Chryseolinea sp.]
MKNILLPIVVALLLTACGAEKKESTSESFEKTLGIHLDAILSSNLTALAPTVADSVTLIGPDGSKMTSKKSFMKLHENWFKRTNWKWERVAMKTQSTGSLGYALIQYKYSERDSLGTITFQNENYLVLIFRNFQQGWQLVHDQNTGIPMVIKR